MDVGFFYGVAFPQDVTLAPDPNPMVISVIFFSKKPRNSATYHRDSHICFEDVLFPTRGSEAQGGWGYLLFLYFQFSASPGYLIIYTAVEQLDIRKSSGFKGYQPLLSSNNNPENMGDMHEGFEVGWEELNPKSEDHSRASDGAMGGSNVWPDELPNFREAVLQY